MKKLAALVLALGLAMALGACATQVEAEDKSATTQAQTTAVQLPEEDRPDPYNNLLGVWEGHYSNWMGDEVHALQILVYRHHIGVGARIAINGEIEDSWVTVTSGDDAPLWWNSDTERFVLRTWVQQPPGWRGEVAIYLALDGDTLVSRGLSGMERVELTRAAKSNAPLTEIHEHIASNGACIFCDMPMPHPPPPALQEEATLRFYSADFNTWQRNDYVSLEYEEFTVSGEDWLQDAIAHMRIGWLRDIWYEGRRLYADFLPMGQNHLQGSANTARWMIFISLASFPNVDEIVVLVGSKRDFSTDHGSFAGVAVITGSENPRYIFEEEDGPGVLRWEPSDWRKE